MAIKYIEKIRAAIRITVLSVIPIILKALPLPVRRALAFPDMQSISESAAVDDENISSHAVLDVIAKPKLTTKLNRVNKNPTDALKLLFSVFCSFTILVSLKADFLYAKNKSTCFKQVLF